MIKCLKINLMACLNCQRGIPKGKLCAQCLSEMTLLDQSNSCSSCQQPLNAGTRQCGFCLVKQSVISKMCCAFQYGGSLKRMMQQFKFYRGLGLGHVLSQALANVVDEVYQGTERPSLIVPVPLHRFRLMWRGFNQSRLIANQLSKQLAIPVSSRFVRRTKRTRVQSLLFGSKRSQNLRGAFACVRDDLPGHIAIVDDVVTTGSTVEEMAKAIRRVRPDIKIDVWAIARTLR